MNNKIQKIINDSYDEAEKAFNEYIYFNSYGNIEKCDIYMKRYMAFSEHAAKLDLLLNSGSENSGKKDGGS